MAVTSRARTWQQECSLPEHGVCPFLLPRGSYSSRGPLHILVDLGCLFNPWGARVAEWQFYHRCLRRKGSPSPCPNWEQGVSRSWEIERLGSRNRKLHMGLELGQRHLAGQLKAIKKVDQLGKQLGVTHHTGVLLSTGTKVRKEGFAVTEGLPRSLQSTRQIHAALPSHDGRCWGRRGLGKFSWPLLNPDTEEGRHGAKEHIVASLLRQGR